MSSPRFRILASHLFRLKLSLNLNLTLSLLCLTPHSLFFASHLHPLTSYLLPICLLPTLVSVFRVRARGSPPSFVIWIFHFQPI